jgi:hypothetical protein
MSSDAAARIELTRERLRLAMSPPPPPDRGRPNDGTVPFLDRTFFDRVKQWPVLGVVVDALESWWTHHPLRPMAHVAVEASNAVVQPLARRNPIALVAAAALVGAGLVWSKPWRWIFSSALFAGLVPQVASKVVSNLPIESWMTMVGAALAQPRARPPGGEPSSLERAADAAL